MFLKILCQALVKNWRVWENSWSLTIKIKVMLCYFNYWWVFFTWVWSSFIATFPIWSGCWKSQFPMRKIHGIFCVKNLVNKHFELSSERKKHLWKKKVISTVSIQTEKNACYNLIIVIVFDQEVVILPMNSHLLWFDWQVKELTDILVKSQTKFKTTSHFKCQKEEN